MRLTPARLRMLRAVDGWQHMHSFSPSIRDLCVAMGYSSVCTVWKHLTALRELGHVAMNPGIARTVRVTEAGREVLDKDARTEGEGSA